MMVLIRANDQAINLAGLFSVKEGKRSCDRLPLKLSAEQFMMCNT